GEVRLVGCNFSDRRRSRTEELHDVCVIVSPAPRHGRRKQQTAVQRAIGVPGKHCERQSSCEAQREKTCPISKNDLADYFSSVSESAADLFSLPCAGARGTRSRAGSCARVVAPQRLEHEPGHASVPLAGLVFAV